MRTGSHRGIRVLIGASLLSAVLGSIHAFSVFLEPLETQFQASRGKVSLTYSGALFFLTLMVLFGHRIYGQASAPLLCLFAVLLGAFGASVAAVSQTLWGVWIGFSLFFGLANGIGYGFGLQISAQANQGREGMAMGVVTAAYALGAVVSPILFERSLTNGGFQSAMTGLAFTLLGVGLMSAMMMRGIHYIATRHASHSADATGIWPIWLAYFGGVMAGLMVIGHAAGIATTLDPNSAMWVAPAVVAGCNLVGSLLGGMAVDRMAARWVVGGFATITAGALLSLAVIGAPAILVSLGLVGFAYGGTIAAWPSVISKRVGMAQSAKIYGRVFTAWGIAGVAGPWLAGTLYDGTGSYGIALVIAAMFAGVSAVKSGWILRSGV